MPSEKHIGLIFALLLSVRGKEIANGVIGSQLSSYICVNINTIHFMHFIDTMIGFSL